MNNFEVRTNKKKEAIIKSALKLFQNNGIAKTSVQNIAKEANVSQVSIYNYYGSKNDLIAAAIEFITKKQIADARKILTKPLTYPEKLTKVFTYCAEDLSKEIQMYFAVDLQSNESRFLPILIETLNKEKRAIYQEFIELGKSEKYITTKISTESIVLFMESMNFVASKTTNEVILSEELQFILFNGILIK